MTPDGKASRMTLLVVGATGSVGHLVVNVAVGKGHAVRALVRDARKAGGLVSDATIVGDFDAPRHAR